MNNQPPTQQATASAPTLAASGLVACGSGSSGSGGTALPLCVAFALGLKGARKADQAGAWPCPKNYAGGIASLRQQLQLLIKLMHLLTLTTAPAAPTTPPTSRAPHHRYFCQFTWGRRGAQALSFHSLRYINQDPGLVKLIGPIGRLVLFMWS
jgi:hypothetical protein